MKVAIPAVFFIALGAGCINQKADELSITIEREISRALQTGDSFEDIEAFLTRSGMLFDFDYDSSRFQARLPKDERNADNIAIYLFVDIDGRFLRAEVERVYTWF